VSTRPSRKPQWAEEFERRFDERFDRLSEDVAHVRSMAEPVAKAYERGQWVLSTLIAAAGIFGAVLTAWWTGTIAAVARFLHHPPTP
jgi:hypothetical protein